MFRGVLQENEFVLRGLIGTLLNLGQIKIKSTVISNSIKLGEKKLGVSSRAYMSDMETERGI